MQSVHNYTSFQKKILQYKKPYVILLHLIKPDLTVKEQVSKLDELFHHL